MTAAIDTDPPRTARNVRLYRSIPALLRDPMGEVEKIGRFAGELVRVDFGIFKAYVATHPDDVQHILRDDSANFLRNGTAWRPLRRLFGDSILGEGPDWELSRKALQPLLTTRHVHSVAGRMAEAVNDAIEPLTGPARDGSSVKATPEMARIVNRTVLSVFFGGKISAADNDRLAPAFDQVAKAVAFRFLLPFLPESVPVPGDRAFREAVQRIDDVLMPLIHKQRRTDDASPDFFSALCQARTADGGEVSDRWIRDNLVAMFATSTETTVGALTWLWPLLDAHPQVAARLYDEIDRVVGRGPVQAEHLSDLTYTRQVLQEVLRLYPVGWLFPRTAVAPARLGGVRINAGDTVLLSPFLTHRLERFWDRPRSFDPDRFATDRTADGGRRHRYAYFPFGGGPHQCIGMHAFTTEAELVVAGVLSRFRPVSCSAVPVTPRIGPTLRPRRDVDLTLRLL
ncbi:cytochrome P450 [Actinoallomurus purpureus]|uniref:cytochrome P450 n=1 Tax=Actinoallomurus purpureus TaxID=478114 RepID=UPI002092331B|nr:cytochrome P450 [Actinoallomurus purpureus]MCO6010668.1 cytochrome P450 [Actinoallomurus purpureus]